MLTMEMDKAKSQLEMGEQTLNEKLEEFEKTKEEAFKKASLRWCYNTRDGLWYTGSTELFHASRFYFR